MEEWKDIKGYEGYYQVSNLGRVRSVDREITYSNGREQKYKGKLLKRCFGTHGYLHACLTKNGSTLYKKIHRLVWEAFNGEIPSGMQVNHIDEDKTNNKLDNLNLLTPKENANWGTRNKRVSRLLINHKLLSKPVYGYDKYGYLVVSFPSTREAGRNGFHQSHVAACARGEKKTHKGLIWSFEPLEGIEPSS